MKTKHWCRSCAAYGESPCATVGHISEIKLVDGRKWHPKQLVQLVVAVPPSSGRGSVEWVACDDQGAPL